MCGFGISGLSMPSNAIRPRIDWCPGEAASEAVEIARELFPHLRKQEVIDRLVITGLYALKQPPWAPPQFVGSDRDKWALPDDLRRPSSGKSPPKTWLIEAFSRDR